MREILFRGKRKDNGEWIVGHLLRYEDGRARIIESHTDIFCFANDPDTTVVKTYEVDPETVGQFTELPDKNGKIFEGDIVRNGDYTMIVVWCDFYAAFMLSFRNNGDYFEAISNSHIYLEVIGNIHDNPELLENP